MVTDMNVAVKHITAFLAWLDEYRENGFEAAESTAKEIVDHMDVACEFTPIRTRKKRSFVQYESQDSILQNPKHLFKTEYFLCIVDSIRQSISVRFQQLQAFVSKFEVLNEIASLRHSPSGHLLDKCLELTESLRHGTSRDINGHDLCEELKCFSYIIPEKSFAKTVLKYLIDHSLTEAYPNLFVALHIFLTAPVTVAGAERMQFFAPETN